MIIKKLTLTQKGFPEMLRHIPSPPEQLYISGTPLKQLLNRPRVAIVGSRKMTAYGQQVTTDLATDLAGRGIVIVSGLAVGVDATAQAAALKAGGQVIAVLPGPLERILPAINRPLALRIIENGGTLVSEYGPEEVTYKQNFVIRNRLVAGLADAVLITEATLKSGSLHTANFTLQQGKDVLAVPGNITSAASEGTNNLLKAGATPVTSYSDVLHALGLAAEPQGIRHRPKGRTAAEQTVLDLLFEGVSDGARLLEESGLEASQFNQILTMLEIRQQIRPLGANHWSLS